MTADSHPCPSCGNDPTAESLAESNLKDLGYLHDDRRLECGSCDNSWTVGLPRGECESDRWVCDACDGDLIPHFVYLHTDDDEVRVKPKCQSCYWVPDTPVVMDTSDTNGTYRWFVAHHTTTGSRDNAERNSL